ncbi:MAG: hypothetical protein QOD72_1459 [Acidimicrobiaceae bacterium]|jgi:hypothetical protein|nr:hypothetical protein [Acidimicrobiaceae bacterium]
MTTLAEHWSALASVGLLGTDRRPAPEPPPGALRDLLEAGPPADHAESVLAQVAAVAAARRAGLRPAAPIARPDPCPVDDRPPCPRAAMRRLFELLDTEPALLDEWLGLVETGGFRIAPDAAVALLARYRSDSARRDIVAGLAGPLAEWITEQFRSQLGARRGVVGSPAPMPSEFEAAVTAPTGDAIALVARVVSDRSRVRRDQTLLVRLLTSVAPSSLAAHIAALDDQVASGRATPFVLALLDLARTRRAMIDEFS